MVWIVKVRTFVEKLVLKDEFSSQRCCFTPAMIPCACRSISVSTQRTLEDTELPVAAIQFRELCLPLFRKL